jgi:hypothetical protein
MALNVGFVRPVSSSRSTGDIGLASRRPLAPDRFLSPYPGRVVSTCQDADADAIRRAP